MLRSSEIVGSAFLLLSMVMLADACPAQGGVTWQLLAPAITPSPRWSHNMAYDAVRQRVVLFGGWGSSGRRLNDTWEWDGVNWTQATPTQSPAARHASTTATTGPTSTRSLRWRER